MSEHIGEPHKQTLEILHNLNALITQTEQRHGITCGQWYGQALFKIYIRYPEHFAMIRDILQDQLPSHTQVLYLQGEMCRRELLLEIEGILSQEKSININHTMLSSRVRIQQPALSQHAKSDKFRAV